MNRKRLGPVLLALGIPLLAIGLLFFAAGVVYAAPQVRLDQCANGNPDSTSQCSINPPGGSVGWINGNSNSQKSTYQIGQFIAYRFEFNDLVPGATYCGAFGWDVAKSGRPAIDYVSTYSKTMTLADPTLDTDFEGQRLNPTDKIAIPSDPALGLTMQTATFSGSQQPGTINLWGANFVNKGGNWGPDGLIYANMGQFADGNLASGGAASAQSLEYCFSPVVTQTVMALAGHIARPVDWGNLPRPSGSPYHMRYGSNSVFTAPRTSINDFSEELVGGGTNHYTFGNIEVQLDVSDPTAITLQNISASGNSAGTGLVIAAVGLLAIGTGLILVLRKRQPVES